MKETDAEQQFADYISRLRYELYEDYLGQIEDTFVIEDESRNIQVFIMRDNNLVGLIRSVYDKNTKELILHYVYVSKKYQGKGYVGEMLSLLFEYLNKIKVLKNIKFVSLSYFASSEAGWVAYDKGISRYGFKNKKLKYTDEDLKDKKFIAKIHNDSYSTTMEWVKITSGSGMLIKPVEAIEMRI